MSVAPDVEWESAASDPGLGWDGSVSVSGRFSMSPLSLGSAGKQG